MTDPAPRPTPSPTPSPAPRSTDAGGFLLAAALLGGTLVGLLLGEPSIGFLAGLALGVAIALLIWLRGRG